jgi:peptidoglycan/xylan/chitin deacetylase (PgdA/CDA1 family)
MTFTFDVEDFTNKRAFMALQATIELLDRYGFNGIFLITGHVAESLYEYPKIVELLEAHEVGYHSSGHSVHPTIFEFTDVKSYREAYEISLKRETSHINPLTGQTEGEGGIIALQKIFPSKKITAFRAPGYCWSPPHLEALRDLGIKFDFSAILSKTPVYNKGITFYPYPILAQWNGKPSDFRLFWITTAKNPCIVIGLHPSLFATYDGWDKIYFNGNPKTIVPSKPREPQEVKSLIRSFDLFLKNIKILEKLGLIEVTTKLENTKNELVITNGTAEKCYAHSMRWARNVFHYKPRYLRNHFHHFFNVSASLNARAKRESP